MPDEDKPLARTRIIQRFEASVHGEGDAVFVTKKAVRKPRQTVAEAVDAYPDGVVHSEGHRTRNAARSAQKRINLRKGAWAAFEEYAIEAAVVNDAEGGWSVVVYVTDPRLDRGAL